MASIGRRGYAVALARLEARKTDATGATWEPVAWLWHRINRRRAELPAIVA
jgi:hypothetical protein